MINNLYAISYKENNTVERDLVSSPDILSAVQLYVRTYPDRSILSVVYQSKVLV